MAAINSWNSYFCQKKVCPKSSYMCPATVLTDPYSTLKCMESLEAQKIAWTQFANMTIDFAKKTLWNCYDHWGFIFNLRPSFHNNVVLYSSAESYEYSMKTVCKMVSNQRHSFGTADPYRAYLSTQGKGTVKFPTGSNFGPLFWRKCTFIAANFMSISKHIDLRRV